MRGIIDGLGSFAVRCACAEPCTLARRIARKQSACAEFEHCELGKIWKNPQPYSREVIRRRIPVSGARKCRPGWRVIAAAVGDASRALSACASHSLTSKHLTLSLKQPLQNQRRRKRQRRCRKPTSFLQA